MARPPPTLPLKDFSVRMPRLSPQAVDFQGLPSQIKVALDFMQAICPQDILRDDMVANSPPLLPPPREEHRGRRTVVFDLDETLVHCHPTLLGSLPPPALELRIDVVGAAPLHAHVYVRPYAKLVLELAARVFEVVVFTASASIYADQVLDFLDPGRRCVTHRLYRQHCTEIAGGHFKDMRRLGRDVKDVVLIDNSPLAAGLCPDNGILVSSWFGYDSQDEELLDVLDVLDECAMHASMPVFLAERYGFSAFLQAQRERLAAAGLPPWAFFQPCAGPVTQVQAD